MMIFLHGKDDLCLDNRDRLTVIVQTERLRRPNYSRSTESGQHSLITEHGSMAIAL